MLQTAYDVPADADSHLTGGRESSTLPATARPISLGMSAAAANHPGVFERIFADDVTVCVWNRPPDPILTRYLSEQVCCRDWERRARVAADAPQFAELLSGFPADVGLVHWMTDLTALVDLFATLTDAQTVGLRLSATARATCPRFHCDQVGLRMLCTWVGEGTEWLAEEDVMREALGPQRNMESPMRPGAKIHRMAPFAVGAFKGDLWPGNSGHGAVHRSPQPRGRRVFVSLDAL